VNTPRPPSSQPPESSDADAVDAGDVFAGLVPIDVIDGELVPRRARG
jgi:hypothetical protein